jgi:hypothetical protein
MKIGLYDPRYKSNYEDVNLSNRLRAAGYNILYQPAAGAEHVKRDNVFSVLDMDWRWWIYHYEGTGKYSSIGKTVAANWRKMLDYVRADVEAKRVGCLTMDVLLFFLHTYKDILQRPRLKRLARQATALHKNANRPQRL